MRDLKKERGCEAKREKLEQRSRGRKKTKRMRIEENKMYKVS